MVLPITLTTASILALWFIYLSVSVTRARFATGIGLGSDADQAVPGGQEHHAPPLFVAIRAHGSFAEYVPLTLIQFAALELNHANATALEVLAGTFVVARIIQPIGLGRKSPNVYRAGGNILQWLVMVALGVYGLALVMG